MRALCGFSFPAQALTALCLGFLLTAQANAKVVHAYTVEVDHSLKGLQVSACFTQPPPKRLVNYDDHGQSQLKKMELISGGVVKRLRPRGNRISLAGLTPGDCVNYQVKFGSRTTHPWFKTRQSTDRQVLVDIHQWLWFPEPFNTDTEALEITFKLPDGVQVSAPWSQTAKGKHFVTYYHDLRPADWPGRVAIGHFETSRRDIGDSNIHIALLNGKHDVDSEAVFDWVNKSLDALTLTYGEFPVPNLQLLVAPVGADREPVPWGQAMRGGGDAVHVYIDETRPLQEFLDDWVLVHELGHLLHPWITRDDAWLYEGLASYYQNVLRARADLLSANTAWEKLHRGFQRGIRGTAPDRTLQQVTETMSRDRAFMRVYWSGAAISLLADYQLRSNSNGKQSLDTALAKFRKCCLPARRQWTGWEVMQQLDRLTQTGVFTDLYRQHVPSTDFPDLSAVYDNLGLVEQDDQITLSPAAHADIRQAIMSPTK